MWANWAGEVAALETRTRVGLGRHSSQAPLGRADAKCIKVSLLVFTLAISESDQRAH